MKKKLLLLAVFYCLFVRAFSQGEIPVDFNSGMVSIQLPLWTVTDHDLTESVSMVYDANSIKAGQPAGFCGLGWQIRAGYQVSREVRGLPDDFGYNNTRKGWFYVNNSGETCASDIAGFSVTADQSASTVSDEAADYSKINGFNYLTDPEPDIFHYSVGGYSGSFVFDGNNIIRTMPYRDLKIEYTKASASDQKIVSFKITTNTGYAYTFAQTGSVTKTVVKNSFLNSVYALSTEYEFYKTPVTYNSEWRVSRIDSPSGAYITFTYIADTATDNNQSVNAGFYTALDPKTLGSTDLRVMNLYTVQQTVSRMHVSDITGSAGMHVIFNHNASSETLDNISVYDDRRGTDNLVKKYTFGYRAVSYADNGFPVYSRQFLESVTESSGCDAMPPYIFTYTGLRSDNVLPYPGNSVDLWGFYNGAQNSHLCPKLYIYPAEPLAERYRYTPIPSYPGTEIVLNGADRLPSNYLMTIGTLNSIKYPGGGSSWFQFEPNEYYDARTGKSLQGGGMRISSIVYNDGMNTASISKYFNYKDASGNSSGRLLVKPVFFVPAFKWKDPNKLNSTSATDSKQYASLSGNDVWKYLTLRTDIDLSAGEMADDSPVGYTVVTVNRSGAGAAKFEYFEPAVYGEISNGSWEATQNRFARPNTSPALEMGVAAAWNAWSFPCTPNPNFGYERGLLWKKTEYNEAGNIVRQTENTYQYLYKSGAAPVKVWGLRYDKYAFSDDNGGSKIYFYGKYFLLTDVDKVLRQETVTTYDAAIASKFATEISEYTYGSANHKLLTQVKKTVPGGTQYSSYIRYPKDYTSVSSNGEDAVLMLNNLQNNFRHGVPIEQYSTIKKTGDYERVTSGNIVKYSAFTLGRPLPASEWELRVQKPVRIDSFSISSVVLQGAYKLNIDPGYEQTAGYTGYLNYDNPAGAVGINKIPSAMAFGYNYTLPVVQAINATASQFAFADFETTTGYELQAANARYGTGRTGVNALYPAVTLTRNVDKAQTGNYILAFWVKNSASQNFVIALKNTAATTTYYTNTFSVAAGDGATFSYIEQVIPVTAVPAGTFRFELTGQGLTNPAGSSAGLLPVIDDVAFYPENASVTSYTYEIPYGSRSVTRGGVTAYTTYDKLGRVKYILDQNQNIVQKKSYSFAASSVPLVADFTVPWSPIYANEANTFKAADNACLTSVTYEWDFGSGYTTGAASQSYTFTTAGTKTIRLRVTSGATVKTISKAVTVYLKPVSITICAKGVQEYSASANVIVSSYACSSVTATPPAYGVVFTVNYTDVSEELVFKWKIRDVGTAAWIDIGSGMQYTYTKVVSSTRSFEIQCDVTSTTSGRTGSSNVMTVTVSQ